METTSGTVGTMMTRTGTFTPVLPVVLNVVLGQRAKEAVAIDLSGHAAPVRRQFPVVKANGVVAKRDQQADLRPPPRWGLNE